MANDLQLLIGKILTDDGFAQALANQPKETLKAADIEPTAELLEALNGVSAESLKQLAATFGQNKAAV